MALPSCTSSHLLLSIPSDPAVYPYSLKTIYPVVPRRVVSSDSRGVVVKLQSQYPVFDLCKSHSVPFLFPRFICFLSLDPAVYPFNLETIYPAVPRRSDSLGSRGVAVKLQPHYPAFDICK